MTQCFSIILLLLLPLVPQDKNTNPNSPVFKTYRPPTSAPRLEHSDATYQMWESFRVLQSANSGDAISQFELSIRYLTGRGFKADTVKAAYWTKRAADKNHLLARFNLGIFQFNGWGTEWNPFESYRNFRFAAEQNIPEAQYALAQFLTENLVVPTHWDEAYRWVKLSADSGYAPARAALAAFTRRGYGSSEEGVTRNEKHTTSSPAAQLLFLDFSGDTLKATPDWLLLDDLRKAELVPESEYARIGAARLKQGKIDADSALFNTLQRLAEAGSPEALTLLGRCYENSLNIPQDILGAAVQYIRAIRLDSPRASRLLHAITQRKEFYSLLTALVNEGNAGAQYVWSCLIALGFDHQLSEAQALHMLESASSGGYTPAMVELGLCYYAGRWTGKSFQKAEALWHRAMVAGNNDARVRLAIAKVRGAKRDYAFALPVLHHAASEGSVLAEFALGYCFETGSGVPRSRAEAARLYRSSAQRGSQDAFRALQRLHDTIRPKDGQFRIDY